ncbi:hypothetical protein [Halorubrum laminariae]|uniref:PrgI family protein n=1 Tax=Halorubrum laminariae TaxID=1433523 RepID=A0ABD6C0F4_9EURY|nr:hypothetical protein [Halorubrum laminariae]
MEPVPVAEKLLKTKLFGFSLQRLLQSYLVPMAPGLILTVLNFPAIIFGPAVLVGGAIGTAVYVRTPEGQSPAAFLFGMVRYYLGPDRFMWKPIQTQTDPVEIQDGPENTQTEKPPEEDHDTNAMFGDENTIENLDFEAVHDDGVIETDEAYALMIEIEPRPWLILDSQSRKAVYHSFSQFLMGVKSPIQIFTLPVPFNAEEYAENVKKTNKNKPPNESKYLEFGRIHHVQWLEKTIEMGEIRDRRHFITVTAQKYEEHEEAGAGSFLDRFRPKGSKVDQEKRYDELWSRADNVKSALPRTGVDTNAIDNRDDALEVLYYYYKGREPPASLDHGWLTKGPTDADSTPSGTETIQDTAQTTPEADDPTNLPRPAD